MMARYQSAVLAAFLMIATATGAQAAQDWTAALNHAAMGAPDARIVVLDRRTGHIVASHHLGEAARTLAAPGSTLKPLILYESLASGRWDPGRRIACEGTLLIAGHRLACSHPAAPPFDARTALAWSCNSYFAEVARSMHPGELAPIFRSSGLLGLTGMAADEAIAEFHEPHTPQETQLMVLGVQGILITPLELATAYRWLANELDAHPDARGASTVLEGLADSAEFGMAQPVSQNIVPVAGKTGTAESAGSHQTHGWFAGFAPIRDPQVVVMVFLPSGRGADAAQIAGLLLAHAPASARRQ